MRAEIIAVGTEILLGEIVNTNATYLSEYLTNLGFDLYHQQVVGDNEGRLLSALDEATQRADLIVLCGGLGPTEDDLTKQTTAAFLGREIHYDPLAMKRLEDYFGPDRVVTENNKRQALTIDGGTTIQNPAGLACGVLYQADTTFYLLLPGPPREMKAMAEENVRPLLRELLPNTSKLVSKYLHFIGIGESRLAADLNDLIVHQTNPTIATYAKSNEVMLRITAKSETEAAGLKLLEELEKTIFERVGDYFYGYGENLTIEEAVISLLKERQAKLSVVEGLSGGLCQGRLTDVPGSSEVFEGGLVAYSSKSKEKLLSATNQEVDHLEMINEQVVKALAEAVKEEMETDYGLAIIGVGGPEEIEGKPVGTVYIGLATESKTISQELIINRERDYIKDGAVKHALNLLRKELI